MVHKLLYFGSHYNFHGPDQIYTHANAYERVTDKIHFNACGKVKVHGQGLHLSTEPESLKSFHFMRQLADPDLSLAQFWTWLQASLFIAFFFSVCCSYNNIFVMT